MKKYLAGLAGSAALLPVVVHAAVPAGVSTALTDATADGATVAGLVIAAIVAIFAFTLMRKALR